MWPYEYSRPQPTPWLWVSEGITDYYADLAELRGGVVDEKGFYALTAGKLNEVADVAPTSLEDASLNTWIHPVDGTEFIYYPKGSLAGLLLDIMIRDASDNAHSLDDVMRGLYQSNYKHGRGFTASDWWSAVSAAAGGKSFAAFSAKYIDGRAPFPIDSVLPLAGLRARAAMVPRLGVMTQLDSNGVMVAQVQDGSAAAAAGVRAGDYLLTVGDVAVQDAAIRCSPARQIRRVGRGLSTSDQGAARIGDAHAAGEAALRTRGSDGRTRSGSRGESGQNSEWNSEGHHRLKSAGARQPLLVQGCRW